MSDTKNKRTASENHHYFLATFYGDHSNGFDLVVHLKNAVLWNAWVCQELSEDEIEDLKKTNPKLTILDWTEDLQKTVNDAFANRFPNEDFPNYPGHIDFLNVQFDHDVYFNGFIFPMVTEFQSAHFGGLASFKDAQFTGLASFRDAKFTKEAIFSYAQFTEEASFSHAKFKEDAIFSDAQFTEMASFMSAQFTEDADFTSSCFSSEARFVFTKFSKKVIFFNTRFDDGGNFGFAEFGDQVAFDVARFKNPAYFTLAKFKRFFPSIGGETLSGKSSLTARADFWPKVADYSADASHLEVAISSCAHLRHNMTAQGLPDEAHFFFRREMDLRLRLSQGVKKLPLWLYGKLSDYGYSYGRPLSWLIQLWLVWTLVYTPYFLSKAGVETLATKTTALAKAAGLSFANIFAFFGFHSRFAEIEWSKASNWLIAFTGLETILGFILLFFLGLGLRNQFRLK